MWKMKTFQFHRLLPLLVARYHGASINFPFFWASEAISNFSGALQSWQTDAGHLASAIEIPEAALHQQCCIGRHSN